MKQFERTRGLFDADITARVLVLDEGIHVSVFGGTQTHIGAVSIAPPSGTVETIQFPGHKDAVISECWAKALADAGYRPCVVEAGIHYDALDREEIDAVVTQTEVLLAEVLEVLMQKDGFCGA